MPATKNRALLDKWAACIYGCSQEEAVRLNGGAHLTTPGSDANRYQSQRGKARKRGISWEISLAEWIAVWADSGKRELRGRGKGRYCMARHGDCGPYRVGNVSIILASENSREGIKQAVMPTGPHPRLGKGRGWTFVPGRRRRPYQVMVGKKFIGTFATQGEAEAAYAAVSNQVRGGHAVP